MALDVESVGENRASSCRMGLAASASQSSKTTSQSPKTTRCSARAADGAHWGKPSGPDARGRRSRGEARAAHPHRLTGARMAWPTDITAMDKGRTLEVVFDDGETVRLTAERLRVESASAEVQRHSPSEKRKVTGKENVAIVDIQPIGNYAIRIVFARSGAARARRLRA